MPVRITLSESGYGLMFRRHEARQMADVSRSDNNGRIQVERLGRQDNVAIEGGVWGRGLTGASCLSPELGCQSHRVRGKGKVVEVGAEAVQVGKGRVALDSDQFPADFIIRDLGQDDPSARRPKRGQPRATCRWLRAVIRIGKQSQGTGIKDNDRAQRILSSFGSGKGSRSPVAFRLALSARHRSYPSGKGGAVAITANISSRVWAALIRRA